MAPGPAGPAPRRPLPPALALALADLLAQAIVADIRQYPNLAEIQEKEAVMVGSPTGHARSKGAPWRIEGRIRAYRKGKLTPKVPSGVAVTLPSPP